MIFRNTENRKTNGSQKLILNLSKRLGLRSTSKYVALQNLSIYYVWKNIRQQYKNHKLKMKLKIIAPTWHDEFELPDSSSSVSDIQDYINYVLKNMKHCLLILLFIFTSTGLIIDWCSKWQMDISLNSKRLKRWSSLVAQKSNTQNNKCRKCTTFWSGWSSFSAM